MVELPGDLLARVRAFNRHHRLLEPGARVLVACSGGADSLAALALLGHPDFGLTLVVGHVDHGLHPGSAEAAGAVARLAEELGLPCVAETLELGGAGASVSEETAREARLATLEIMADEQDAERIVLAHTASDQLETLIMRLVRGAGLRGLAGMPPQRGRIVRPLLPLTNLETRRLVTQLGWTPQEDPSNGDDAYFRNRIRHHVVPRLEAENPRVHEQAFRTAENLREEHEALVAVTAVTWNRSVALDGDAWTVRLEDLGGLPAGLRARLLRRMWWRAQGGAPTGELTRQHLEYVGALLHSSEGSQRIDLPGDVVALREYGYLRLCPAAALEDPGDRVLEIPGPGLYREPDLGWVLEAVSLKDPSQENDIGLDTVWLRPGEPAGAWSLVARNLRPGDRVQGAAGRKKVGELLIDHKVPRHRRRRWPLVVAQGEIVWIPGIWKAASPVVLPGEDCPGAGEFPTCQLRFRTAEAEV